MVQQEQAVVNGYEAGSLERLIRAWAIRFWSDATDEYNWRRFKSYYASEYVKSMRKGLN